MYHLDVYYPGEAAPRTRLSVERAEALEAIPAVLNEHHDCERIVVTHGVTRLFAVDCRGDRLPD